jgi:hypothetical protein
MIDPYKLRTGSAVGGCLAPPSLSGKQTVTGNPKEYRRHATRCAELAAAARPQHLKVALLVPSKSWEHLAIDLENGVVMFDDVEVVRSEVRQPLDE